MNPVANPRAMRPGTQIDVRSCVANAPNIRVAVVSAGLAICFHLKNREEHERQQHKEEHDGPWPHIQSVQKSTGLRRLVELTPLTEFATPSPVASSQCLRVQITRKRKQTPRPEAPTPPSPRVPIMYKTRGNDHRGRAQFCKQRDRRDG